MSVTFRQNLERRPPNLIIFLQTFPTREKKGGCAKQHMVPCQSKRKWPPLLLPNAHPFCLLLPVSWVCQDFEAATHAEHPDASAMVDLGVAYRDGLAGPYKDSDDYESGAQALYVPKDYRLYGVVRVGFATSCT